MFAQDLSEEFGMRNLLEYCLSELILRHVPLGQHHALLPLKSLNTTVIAMPVVLYQKTRAIILGRRQRAFFPTRNVEVIIRIDPNWVVFYVLR